MAINMRLSRRTEIYAKEAVSDTNTMYFHQAMKENGVTPFLKTTHKEFVDLISMGILN